MYYGYTREDTDWKEEDLDSWKLRVLKVIFFFIPRANPDIERQYPLVKRWLLEVSDDGWPNREIAFDADGKVLFRTPNDRNTGWFTDMGEREVKKSDLEIVDAAEFVKYWEGDA